MIIMGFTTLFRPLHRSRFKIITPTTYGIRHAKTWKQVAKEQLFTKSGRRVFKDIKLAQEVIKKQNWQNDALFGPLLKTASQRRQDLQCGMVAFTPEAIAGVVSRGPVDAIPSDTTDSKIRVVETGFKHVDILTQVQKDSKTKKRTAKKLRKTTGTESDTEANVKAVSENLLTKGQQRVVTNDTENAVSKVSDELAVTTDVKRVTGTASSEGKQTLKFDDWSVLEFPLINPLRPGPYGELGARQSLKMKRIVKSLNNDATVADHIVTYPSVTRILSKTMPEASVLALKMWERLMISKLGQEGFDDYKRQMLDAGTSLHDSINNLLLGAPIEEVDIKPVNAGHWKSVEAVLKDVKNAEILEQKVVHPLLCYQGIVDCVAEYRDRRVVIDWKTSKKPKTTLNATYDSPIQAVAYVGAINFDRMQKIQVDSAMVVIVYESGHPADVHVIDAPKCRDYWTIWLSRLKLYHEMSGK